MNKLKKAKHPSGKRMGRPPRSGKKKAAKPAEKKIAPTNGTATPQGFELLKLETGIKMVKVSRIDLMPEYQKLVEIIPKMQIGQSVPLRKKWKKWPAKAIKQLDIDMRFNVYVIKDNPEYVRAFRVK